MSQNNIATLVAVTEPRIKGVDTANDLIAYVARVSNPTNQNNVATASKLIKYLAKNKHWSPFEMVHVCIEIRTTRDIGRQILRHRSFSFQEFSQRYADPTQMTFVTDREFRLQDANNRQNSISVDDEEKQRLFSEAQKTLAIAAKSAYNSFLDLGLAKEQARALLPEGLTPSVMYMSGSLRSWIHYCTLRMKNGTQKEHADIAKQCWDIITTEFPCLSEIDLSL